MALITVNALDKTIHNHTALLIYGVINDLECYPKWWKNANMTFHTDEVGGYVIVKTLAGEFTLRKKESIENKRVTLEYTGLFTGSATWILEPHGAACRVVYDAHVTTNSGLLGFINKFSSIEKRHSKTIKEMFEYLDRYLSNYHKEKNPR